MSSSQSNVMQSDAAPVLDAKENDERFAKLQERAERFRVLIIGRANAGKTTILKKICNTVEDPEIFDRDGDEIDVSNIEPTALRGYHNIEDEMVFRSNPTFSFHDSGGFEAGGVEEFQKAKAFVVEHAKGKKLKDQVHVIWYCVAMDDDRPITFAEKQFFSESGTGRVPVVVIFTKCEVLEIKAITKLLDEGYDFDEAMEKAPTYVEKFKEIHMVFEAMEFPPKGHVYLQELNKPESDCQSLVECTLGVLDSNILQGLFISTQENTLEMLMKYALRYGLKESLLFKEKTASVELWTELFVNVLGWFPYHFHHDNKLDFNLNPDEDDNEMLDAFDFNNDFDGHDFDVDENDQNHIMESPSAPHIGNSLHQLASNFQHLPVPAQLAHYFCALIIIADHLSVIWSTKPLLSKYIPLAITLYQKSPSYSNVLLGVTHALSGHQDFVQSSPDSDIDTQVAALEKRLLPLILKNRLDKTGSY